MASPPTPPPDPTLPPASPAKAAPAWVLIVGVVFLGLAVLFMMALVVASLFKLHVECDSRFLVVGVMAFCAAIGAAFLGNDAAVRGNIPIPKAANHSLAISAGGGIAVLVMILLLGYNLYVKQCLSVAKPEIEQVSAVRVDDRVVVTVTYGALGVQPGQRAVVECGPNESFSETWVAKTLDNPHVGSATFEVSSVPLTVSEGWVRLVLIEANELTVAESTKRKFTVKE
jgi:hypothetical protein